MIDDDEPKEVFNLPIGSCPVCEVTVYPDSDTAEYRKETDEYYCSERCYNEDEPDFKLYDEQMSWRLRGAI